MQKILQSLENTSIKQLHLWIVLIGMLIASQVQYIQHGWINPDSVLYLEAAKLFSNGDWKAGFEVFNWPFYSLCITLVNKITQLGVHVSAQILNVIFFGMATFAFITIIQLAGGKQKQIIAAALIWLSAPYMIGGVLEMLMRDEGFWAFYLLSIVFFIRFYQQQRLKDALLWQLAMMFASLFRIEAILYLALLPLVLLFNPHQSLSSKLKLVFKAYSVQLALTLLIVCALFTYPEFSTKMLGRLNEIFTSNLLSEFTALFREKSAIMSQSVLGEYLEEFAIPGLMLTFIYVIIIKVVFATGLITMGLAVLGIKHRHILLEQKSAQILMATTYIALLSMALIITKVFVLSGRYVLALSFILMVFASFFFAHLLFKQHVNTKTKWLVRLLILFMLACSVKNILPKQQGYNYMQDAVAWIQVTNNNNKPVFYDQARMRYYADEPFKGTFGGHLEHLNTSIADKTIFNYHYLLIESSNKNNVTKNLIKNALPEYTLINQFNDAKAKKSVLIYQKK